MPDNFCNRCQPDTRPRTIDPDMEMDEWLDVEGSGICDLCEELITTRSMVLEVYAEFAPTVRETLGYAWLAELQRNMFDDQFFKLELLDTMPVQSTDTDASRN